MESSLRPERTQGEGRGWLIAIVAITVLAIGAAVVWNFRDRLFGTAAPVTPTPVADPAPQPAQDPAQPKSPEEGDALLRKLAADSKSELLQGWLQAPGILQRVAAATRLISVGKSPLPVLQFLELKGDFTAKERGGRLYIAPESYARYDAITAAFMSVDAAKIGAAYGELRPYFDSAYAQVAAPGEHFDEVLIKAVKRLLAVKISDEPIELAEKGALYVFKDPALEGLAPAEKHVLRMGPNNGREMQGAVRRFAEAAGLPLADSPEAKNDTP